MLCTHLKHSCAIPWFGLASTLAASKSSVCFVDSSWSCTGIIAKTLGAFGSGFSNFGFGGDDDSASRGQKAAKPAEQESSANSWAAF